MKTLFRLHVKLFCCEFHAITVSFCEKEFINSKKNRRQNGQMAGNFSKASHDENGTTCRVH